MEQRIIALIMLVGSFSAQAQFAPPVPMTELLNINIKVTNTELFDVDGDADQDLLISSSECLSLRLNEGNGVFGAYHAFHTQSGGGSDLALGDLDGDGDPDLVQARAAADSILQWFANDGSGGFTLMHTFPYTGSQRKVVTLVDMNGDGDLDICCGTYNAFRIYANNGFGSFGTAVDLGNTLNYASPADLDLDGDLDVLGISDATNTMAFRADTGSSYGAVTSPNPTLGFVTQVLAADLDLDSDSDLVAMSGNNIAVHFNQGGLVFGPQIPIAPGVTDLEVVRAVDLTGDGAPELVGYTDDGDILVFVNDGSGTFSPPTLQNGSLGLNTGLQLYVADLDGDGQQDAVSSAERAVHWHRGAGNGTFLDERVLLPKLFEGAGVGDMDGDGDQDLLLTSAWAEQTAPGDFTLLHTISPRNDTQTAADLNGDGLMDTHTLHAWDATSQDSVIWCKNLGNGSFQRIAFEGGVYSTAYMEACDLDADGDLDLVRGGQYSSGRTLFDYRNDGAGNFTRVADISAGTDQTIRPAIADFDGDGDPDIACHEYQSDDFSVIENTGAPEMAGGPEHFVDQFLYDPVSAAFPGDVDGDGDQDILLVYDEELLWYANNGLGNAWTPHTVALGVKHGRAHCDLDDIDADGDLDVMYATMSDSVAWHANDGSGSFGPRTFLPIPDDDYALDLSDVDVDGDADLVLMAYYAVWVLINQSIDLPTGLAVHQQEQILIAPNPFSTVTRLTLSAPLSFGDMVRLVDVNGRVLRSWSGTGARTLMIERDDLAAGIYLVAILREGILTGSARLVVD